MPVGYHHLHYRNFAEILFNAELKDEAARLAQIEAEEKELRRQADNWRATRIALANRILEDNYDKLRPFLRPCHQRRFDAGKKEIEPEPRGWL